MDRTTRQITFTGGFRWLAVFLAVGIAETTVSNTIAHVWEFGPEVPLVEQNVISSFLSLALVGIVWAILRYEGVRFVEIGLSSGLVVPAIVAVAGFYTTFNAVGIGLAVVTGNLATVGYQWPLSPVPLVGWFGYMIVFAGFAEEILFRGYLQTKLIALLGDDGRAQIALGIATAGIVFALWHLPRIVTAGIPGDQGFVDYMGILVMTGILFGVLYELTQNLYIPVLVHAAGNLPGTIGILFVTPVGWPMWATLSYVVAYLVLFAAMVWVYRRWTFETEILPVWTDREDIRSTTTR